MKKRLTFLTSFSIFGLIISGCNVGVNSKDNDENTENDSSEVKKDFKYYVENPSIPISPHDYQKMLGTGVDVDWSKTAPGKTNYNEQAVIDFAKEGVGHVRIRMKDIDQDTIFNPEKGLGLDRQIQDCLKHGIVPILAYQAQEFKSDPSDENIALVAKWWQVMALRYKDWSHLISFNFLIESTDAINKVPERLNVIFEELTNVVRDVSEKRIVYISPAVRSNPENLKLLTIPSRHNNYLMAEWHFYASGPSKTSATKKWTTGTDEEKALITDKINVALQWSTENDIPTWVGAWMPGTFNTNEIDDETGEPIEQYTAEEMIVFAAFMTMSLRNAKIPHAINSDTKIYDRQTNQWIGQMKPIFDVIFKN